MLTSLAKDKKALAALATAHTAVIGKKEIGKIVYAGNLWPDENSSEGKDVRRAVDHAMTEVRRLVFRGMQVCKAALRDDEQAVATMTTWFGDRPSTDDEDWWQGVDYILAKLNIWLLEDIHVHYRGKSTLGKPTDYPGETGDIDLDDIDGYAETVAGDENLVIGLCSAFFAKGKFRTRTINLTGFNCVGGVLLHEMSHNLCKTKDHSDNSGNEYYGTAACRDLAATLPRMAWYNADNIEYFCEEATYGPEKVKAPIDTGSTMSVKDKAKLFGN